MLRSLTRKLSLKARGKESRPRYLVVGLGNPGGEYSGTRHNAGFKALDRIGKEHGARSWRGHEKALAAMGKVAGEPALLAKPLAYMNRSGPIVARLARAYGIPPERVVVIHDDLDLPVGRIRLRPGGSAGGHRGVASIIQALGTRDFPRIRLGIGRPGDEDPVDYVLGEFSPDERKIMHETYEEARKALETLVGEGMERAMNLHNAGGTE